jgi:hypothetical protein
MAGDTGNDSAGRLPGPLSLAAITTGDGLDSRRVDSFSKVIPKRPEHVGLTPSSEWIPSRVFSHQFDGPD